MSTSPNVNDFFVVLTDEEQEVLKFYKTVGKMNLKIDLSFQAKTWTGNSRSKWEDYFSMNPMVLLDRDNKFSVYDRKSSTPCFQNSE